MLILAILAGITFWGVQQCSVEDFAMKDPTAAEGPLRVDERIVPIAPEAASEDVRAVFSDSDYPAEAQRNGDEGTVQAKLDIDQAGRVTGCTIVRSSGHASLDRTTCRILLERARFAPATNTAGGERRATYITPPVTWRLAEE